MHNTLLKRKLLCIITLNWMMTNDLSDRKIRRTVPLLEAVVVVSKLEVQPNVWKITCWKEWFHQNPLLTPSPWWWWSEIPSSLTLVEYAILNSPVHFPHAFPYQWVSFAFHYVWVLISSIVFFRSSINNQILMFYQHFFLLFENFYELNQLHARERHFFFHCWGSCGFCHKWRVHRCYWSLTASHAHHNKDPQAMDPFILENRWFPLTIPLLQCRSRNAICFIQCVIEWEKRRDSERERERVLFSLMLLSFCCDATLCDYMVLIYSVCSLDITNHVAYYKYLHKGPILRIVLNLS